MPSKDNVLNFLTAFIIRQENSKANCSSWQNIKLKCQDRNKQNLESMFVLSVARSQFSVPQHPICNFHSQSNIILDQTKMLEIKIISLCVCTLNYTIRLDPTRTASTGTPQDIIKGTKLTPLQDLLPSPQHIRRLDLNQISVNAWIQFNTFKQEKKVSKLDADKLLNSN